MDYNIFHLFFRHGITFKEVSGESENVTKEMTAPWEEATLPTILARYQLRDIFNANEFGLFYKALPSKSLHFQGKRCSGGNHSKVRLTGMAVSNTLGEKIPMFLIGKSPSPRSFKHVRNLPCRYRSQRKAWMDRTLFNRWLRELDRKFEMQGRKIVMIFDNYPANPELRSYQLILFTTKYHFLYTADGSGGNQVCLLYYFLILLTKSIESQSNV